MKPVEKGEVSAQLMLTENVTHEEVNKQEMADEVAARETQPGERIIQLRNRPDPKTPNKEPINATSTFSQLLIASPKRVRSSKREQTRDKQAVATKRT